MQVWSLLHAARWKYRRQKSRQKVAIWAPSPNFVGLYLRNEGMYRQLEKNLLSSNMSSTCPHNMVNFGPLAADIDPVVWGTVQISTSFASGHRYCTASSSGRQPNCGIEQRAPPVFGRATITLGIGPHSSFFYLLFFPCLISAVADWMYTILPHMVWP